MIPKFTKYPLSQKPKTRVLILTENVLQSLRFHEWDAISSQLTRYFQQLLAHYQDKSNQVVLQLPSILALAALFHCCESDIFEALHTLKLQSYAYELYSIDSPIRLYAPLDSRKNRLMRWLPSFLFRLTHRRENC